MTPIALTVAGSDPSGGAGLQADLKTFHQHRVYGAAVPTLLTVQNSRGVEAVTALESDLVSDQLRSVMGDLAIGAAKTGALGTRANAQAVAELMGASAFPWVIDPVRSSSSGAALVDDGTREVLLEKLLPGALLVTPNAPEAEWLSGRSVHSLVDAGVAAQEIASTGVEAVLISGGHLVGAPGEVVDVFLYRGQVQEIRGPRFSVTARGTGCALSAAITAWLARGTPLEVAVRRSISWVQRAIGESPALGGGSQPLNHFSPLGDER